MVWVRIDDHFDEHPKIAALSDSAAILFVAGLAYCNRNLTDGFIPHMVGLGQLRFCNGNTLPPIHELEQCGLWVKVEGGWTVHDYPEYQPSRESVLRERDAARQRMSYLRHSRSPEVRPNISRSSRTPVPVPVPSKKKKERTLLANPDGFATFWLVYPKKLGKEQAKKAWNKLHPENGLVEAIVLSVQAHLKTDQWQEYEYIPYPATFLNGRRWEDVLDPAASLVSGPPVDPKIHWKSREDYLAARQAGRVAPARRVPEWEPTPSR